MVFKVKVEEKRVKVEEKRVKVTYNLS